MLRCMLNFSCVKSSSLQNVNSSLLDLKVFGFGYRFTFVPFTFTCLVSLVFKHLDLIHTLKQIK